MCLKYTARTTFNIFPDILNLVVLSLFILFFIDTEHTYNIHIPTLRRSLTHGSVFLYMSLNAYIMVHNDHVLLYVLKFHFCALLNTSDHPSNFPSDFHHFD